MISLKKIENRGRGVKLYEVDESYSFSSVEASTMENLLDEVEMRSMRSITRLKTVKTVHTGSSNPCNPTHLTTHLPYVRKNVHTGSSNPCNLSSRARTQRTKEVSEVLN